MIDAEQEGQGRIDVDEALPSVEIPRPILNGLYAHAIETLPEECCACRNEMTMHHRQNPVEYPRDGSEAFYMNSLDYMMAHEEAEAHGVRVTAVYHSHVGVGAYLSGMDLAYAVSASFPFPDADHIVVAVFDSKVDSDQSFFGRTVVSSDS